MLLKLHRKFQLTYLMLQVMSKKTWQFVILISIKKIKCIFLRKNNDIRNQLQNNQRDEGFNDQGCTSYYSFQSLYLRKKSLKNLFSLHHDNTELFTVAILKIIEELLEMKKIAEENLADKNEHDILTCQELNLDFENSVVFKKFEPLYKQIVDIDYRLLISSKRGEEKI